MYKSNSKQYNVTSDHVNIFLNSKYKLYSIITIFVYRINNGIHCIVE